MNIKEQLQKLLEDDLRKKIVMPLMGAFGCADVRDWHGNSEKGIDVLYKKENDFNELVYKGILLKACEINQREFETSVRGQIEQATGRSFSDPEYPENETRIRGLIVITSFHITQNVRDLIRDFAGKHFPSVEIVDGDRLCGLIDRIVGEHNREQSQKPTPIYYDFETSTFEEFCEKYRNQIHSKRSIDSTVTIGEVVETFEGKKISKD